MSILHFYIFSVKEPLFSKRKIVLVCEGLDTISDIFINDIFIGSSKNMFVRYIFDIKAALTVIQNFSFFCMNFKFDKIFYKNFARWEQTR